VYEKRMKIKVIALHKILHFEGFYFNINSVKNKFFSQISRISTHTNTF